MSQLGNIFKEAGINEDTIKDIVSKLKVNPIDAMAAVQALNLPNEVVQNIMGTVMMNPSAIEELAQELGMGGEDIAAIKDQLNQTTDM
jgi:NACalpha-BTF3-like transcription factor